MTTTIVTCPWCHAEAMYGQPCPHCNHDVGVPRIECGCRACRTPDPLLTDRDPTPPDTAGEHLRDAVAALITAHRKRSHAELVYDSLSTLVRKAARAAGVDLPLVYGGYVLREGGEADGIVTERAEEIGSEHLS
jgi:hypothetical protein